jgi:hypothetical protein
MSASHIESIPMTWDDERDGSFFRCVRDLFTPSFLQGAGVLLASHDSGASEALQVVVATPAPPPRPASRLGSARSI